MKGKKLGTGITGATPRSAFTMHSRVPRLRSLATWTLVASTQMPTAGAGGCGCERWETDGYGIQSGKYIPVANKNYIKAKIQFSPVHFK